MDDITKAVNGACESDQYASYVFFFYFPQIIRIYLISYKKHEL